MRQVWLDLPLDGEPRILDDFEALPHRCQVVNVVSVGRKHKDWRFCGVWVVLCERRLVHQCICWFKNDRPHANEGAQRGPITHCDVSGNRPTHVRATNDQFGAIALEQRTLTVEDTVNARGLNLKLREAVSTLWGRRRAVPAASLIRRTGLVQQYLSLRSSREHKLNPAGEGAEAPV